MILCSDYITFPGSLPPAVPQPYQIKYLGRAKKKLPENEKPPFLVVKLKLLTANRLQFQTVFFKKEIVDTHTSYSVLISLDIDYVFYNYDFFK